jgi:hypothetical protein
MRTITFPDDCNLYDHYNDEFNEVLAKRREHPTMDMVAGVIYLYTAFMFSCGRFKLTQLVRVYFVVPNPAFQTMFAMLGSGFLETHDTSNANIIIAEGGVPTSVPVSALVITLGGSKPKFAVGPAKLTSLFCFPI